MRAYQSITTKVIRPTNTRGTRIKATTSMGLSVTISFDYGLEDTERHWQAVKHLLNVKGLDWAKKYAIGSTTEGYVFVPVYDFNDVAILEG